LDFIRTAIAPISLRRDWPVPFSFVTFGNAVLQRDERIQRLPLISCGMARGGFGHLRMAHERALDFRRADAWPDTFTTSSTRPSTSNRRRHPPAAVAVKYMF